MRKLILIDMLSLDGFYEAPGEGFDRLDWHMVDDAWNEMSIKTLDATDTLLFGRVTYEGFRSFWSTQDDPIAQRINAKEKVAVTTTLTEAGWTNARLLTGDLEAGVKALKAAPGKQIVIYGSGTLARSLTVLGLIDEYHLAYAPVALGQGTPLFDPAAPRLQLKLNGATPLPNGVIYARYSLAA